MTPSLQHTQPLVLDLSVQPHGAYLLTLHGVTTKKYLWLNTFALRDGIVYCYQGIDEVIAAFPADMAWTIVAKSRLELPTIEGLARQGRDDLVSHAQLQRELYPSVSPPEVQTEELTEMVPLVGVSTGQYL